MLLGCRWGVTRTLNTNMDVLLGLFGLSGVLLVGFGEGVLKYVALV